VHLIAKMVKKFQPLIPLFSEFKVEEIWAAIEEKRNGHGGSEVPAEDLKLPEWQIFSNPDSAAEARDFKLRRVAPPKGFEAAFEDTVLVERIREFRALLGFTRIESNADFAEATSLKDGRLTRLGRESPTWLPASEVRGEGIFLRIREDALMAWESKPEVRSLQQEFLESHKAWRKVRKLRPAGDNFPGIRLVLLHSLAHALMRQIVLDCGYTSASIRERLYSRRPTDESGAMAGILLYTAAPDSEGTLGGLVELAPDTSRADPGRGQTSADSVGQRVACSPIRWKLSALPKVTKSGKSGITGTNGTAISIADRGSSMTSKSLALLLAASGRDQNHSRPHVSDDNPFSEANFKTIKYRPGYPDRFGSIHDARRFCQEFFPWYNHQHHHSGLQLLTPALHTAPAT
jgi:hypothetical protein